MSTAVPGGLRDARVHLETAFGNFEVDRRDLVRFPAGLPGFELCRQFVVIAAPEVAPFQCLCSVGGAPGSFLTVDPRLVYPGYAYELTEADRTRLGATADAALLWLAIVTLTGSGEAWANLRAPIVINPDRMVGYQVISPDHDYPVRHALVEA
ncbi:MAG: flagellar assembly protein FliW [Acidobacteriota bacterium]